MSWHPQHGNGAYDASGANGVYHAEQANLANGAHGAYAANGAYQDVGDTQGLPPVYHPYGDGTVAYDGYVDPAAAHGWHDSAATGDPAHGIAHDHIYRDNGYSHSTEDDQDDAGHDDGSVFVDASGRRSRLIRRAAVAVAALCVVFIGVVIAGFFSPVPTGGVLPWSQKQEQKPKQKGSTTATDEPGSTARATADPSATPGESATPSPSASASKTGGETQELPTKAPTTTAASTTSAPGRGNSGDHPGGGQGTTKGPR